MPSQHPQLADMHEHLIQRTPCLSLFSSLQIILPSNHQYENFLQVKPRDNDASRGQCHHTQHPMRILGEAEDDWSGGYNHGGPNDFGDAKSWANSACSRDSISLRIHWLHHTATHLAHGCGEASEQ